MENFNQLIPIDEGKGKKRTVIFTLKFKHNINNARIYRIVTRYWLQFMIPFK